MGEYRRLQAQGYNLCEVIPQEISGCLYLGTKQKEENLWNFGRALSAQKKGAYFVCAMSNELGARRFESILKETGFESFSWSKNHCRVFGCVKGDGADALIAKWLESGEPCLVPETSLLSRPGVFGWNKVDVGSALLASLLQDRLQGRGADFGAGYGYLSWKALQLSPAITELSLVEDEKLALEMSAKNLSGDSRARFFWHDLAQGTPCQNLDFVLMNPPFHAGRDVNLQLGRRFIQEAAGALRARGELYLVANKTLSYEPLLQECFSSVVKLAESSGFKVLYAVR
jgi:16S rRNA (guanine1207-N2)-methyltransferase